MTPAHVDAAIRLADCFALAERKGVALDFLWCGVRHEVRFAEPVPNGFRLVMTWRGARDADVYAAVYDALERWPDKDKAVQGGAM